MVGTGHGITIGSDMSAGVRNVTFQNITMEGTGCGIRMKAERGRGGVVENIVYRDITMRNILSEAVQMTLNYHAGLKPTNATATPIFRNILIENVYADGCAYAGLYDGLPEQHVLNFTLRNVTVKNAKKAFMKCDNVDGKCEGGTNPCPPCFTGEHPPPVPPSQCKLTEVEGCFNDSAKKVLSFSSNAVHDHVTQGNCAAVCAEQKLDIAGIDEGNHCQCGTNADLIAAKAQLVPAAVCDAAAWPCTGVCCGPNAPKSCEVGKCTSKPTEHCGNKGAVMAYSYSCTKISTVHERGPSIFREAAGICRVSASAAWSEFESRNAYTVDGVTHKTSVCSGNKGPWVWQSNGNITVAECAKQAKAHSGQCWDFLCPYKLAADCTCPAIKAIFPAAQAAKVACVGDSITAGYLSSCGLDYPNQLQTLFGEKCNVSNYGSGGKTMLQASHLPTGDKASSYWATQQYAEALASRSDIVVLMLGTNDAKGDRWNLSAAAFPTDYVAMAQSFLSQTPAPKLYLMVPPPLYRDQRYNMNQTVINTIFPGSGPAGVRTIAETLGLPPSRIIDIYAMYQKQCPVVGGTPGHAPNASDVQCDWIGWCSGEQSAQCEGIDGCHPNDIGYGKIASLVKAAITSGERALKTDETAVKNDAATTSRAFPPAFSWNTIPVFIHCALNDGISEAQAAFMASRPLVTIEKFECQKCGPNCGPDCVIDAHQESKMVYAAEKIVKFNSSAAVLPYFNSWIAFDWYNLSQWAKDPAHPNRLCRMDNGTSVAAWGGLYNVSDPEMRAGYIDAVESVMRSPAVSGIFIDFTPQAVSYCDLSDRSCYNASFDQVCPDCATKRIEALRQGQAQLFTELGERLGPGATIVGNPVDAEGCNTLFFESFSQDSDHGRRNYNDIALLQRTWEKKHHAVEARAAGGDRDLVHALATFLVGASEHSYFGSSFSPGWGCEDGWLDGMNSSSPQARLFSKRLGVPLGEATNHTSVYTRRFAAGTDVWLNHTAGGKKGLGWAACIFWADDEVSEWGVGASTCEKPGFRMELRARWESERRGSILQGGRPALKSDDGTGFYATNNDSNNVAYFSWYSYSMRDIHGHVQRAAKEPLASPGKAYTNLAMDGNLTFLRQSYEQLGVPGMLLLQESKWGSEVLTQTGQWPNGSVGLTTGWKAAVDDCIVTLTPLAKGIGGHIHAIQLGDELVCTGFPLSNLSALAARLHDGLTSHGVMIFTNECLKHSFVNDCSSDVDCIKLGSGAGPGVCEKDPAKWIVPNNPAFGGCQTAVWPEIPSGLDAISADVYWTETGDYCPPGKRCPAGNSATEATWAKAYYSHYFLPLLKPHQSVWMLPGLFGPNGTHGSSIAMAATDKDLVEKLAAYWSWADADPKVTGIIPWHWGDLTKGFTPATMRWGGESYPETLAWIKAKVAHLHLPPRTRP